MYEYVERLVNCGFNLIDAYEICEDFMAEEDPVALEEYVNAVEADFQRYHRVG